MLVVSAVEEKTFDYCEGGVLVMVVKCYAILCQTTELHQYGILNIQVLVQPKMFKP